VVKWVIAMSKKEQIAIIKAKVSLAKLRMK